MKLLSGIRSGRKFFLALIMVGGLYSGPLMQAQEASSGASDPFASAHQNTILNLKEGEFLLNRGHWTGKVVDGYDCILFRGDGSSSWNISKCFESGTFEEQATGVAMITREAGTLILNGELGPESGEGRYSFTADRRYNRYLKRNFDNEEVSFSLPLFLGNMETEFMDFLKDHYGEVNAEQVTQLALHEVSQEDFEEYLSLYRQYSDHDPSLDEVVETKNNGIDQAYVAQLHEAGYTDLNLDQMMQANAQGITQEFISGLAAAGFNQIPLDLLLRAKDAGLTVESAQAMQRISQNDLSLEAIIELQKRGITSQYINQLAAAGLTGLDLDQVTRARAMNLDGSLRRSLQEIGVDADFRGLLIARAARVDTALVNQYKSSGLQGAELQDLVAARQNNLNFSQLETWKELGTGQVSFQELLLASRLGINTTDLETFQSAGVEVYSLSELISAKIHGVDMDFIQRTEQGPMPDSISQGSEVNAESLMAAQQALLGTPDSLTVDQEEVANDETPQVEAAESAVAQEETEPVELEPLHYYIRLKLEQDARTAQEAIERRKEAEVEVDQEAQDRGFYQLDLL